MIDDENYVSCKFLPLDATQSAVLPWQVSCPSVCLSVCPWRWGFITDWNASKQISGLISLESWPFAHPLSWIFSKSFLSQILESYCSTYACEAMSAATKIIKRNKQSHVHSISIEVFQHWQHRPTDFIVGLLVILQKNLCVKLFWE